MTFYRCAPFAYGEASLLLNKGPITFSIDERDWEFELTFDGSDKRGKYQLKLNKCPVQKLPIAVFKREEPPLSKSIVLVIDTEAYKSKAY